MPIDTDKIVRWMSAHKQPLLTAVMILCVAGIVCAWEGVVKDRVFPKNFGVVEAGQIYRSGQIAPSLIKKVLLNYNIKVIISLAGDSSEEEKQAAKEIGVERLIFSMRGNGTGSVADYAGAVAAIYRAQQENKPVLVHCAAGTHRTGGVIASYRLIVQKKDVDFVRNEMIHYGFKPDKNINLRTFLNNNMMNIAEELKKMGVIDKMPSSIPEIKG
jgi:protein tyrosine/serine phosphatase